MSSLWAWDLQKLVAGHTPHPLANGPSCHIYSSVLGAPRSLVWQHLLFLFSTHRMQAELGPPRHLVVCGGSLRLGWGNDSLRSNDCFPGLSRAVHYPEGWREGIRGVGQMCDSLGS